jgi:hypothetical protein
MRDPNPDLRARINETQAEIDRFEGQAAAIMALTLALSVAAYSILLQVLP